MRNSQAIRKILMKLGIAPHMVGFTYIEEAVTLWYPGSSTTKELYPVIARNNKTTAAAVEKSIRAAIKYAWDNDRGNTGMIFQIFGLWAIAQRPKAAGLIAAVAMWTDTEGETDED